MLVEALRANPFVLAPMAGITDRAFRTFMKNMNAGVVVTELVSATGIEYKSERTVQLMGFDEIQRPVGIQLFGEDPEVMGRAAAFAQELGCDFVDINFGCPVPKVTKKGAGSAALKDLPHMTKLIAGVKKSISIPLTIKIRTGWDQSTRNADEVVKIAYNEGVTWVAIHGRTRAQSYSGFADWDYIAEVKSKAQLPILGNGDITTAQQAVDRMNQSGVDGVLIGRGALKNPFLFTDALQIWNQQQAAKGKPVTAVKSTMDRDFALVFTNLKDCLAAQCDDRILQIQLKKFAAWFATGYPNSAQFRKSLFQSKDTAEVIRMSLDYFSGIDQDLQLNENNEGFLMGGHG